GSWERLDHGSGDAVFSVEGEMAGLEQEHRQARRQGLDERAQETTLPEPRVVHQGDQPDGLAVSSALPFATPGTLPDLEQKPVRLPEQVAVGVVPPMSSEFLQGGGVHRS